MRTFVSRGGGCSSKGGDRYPTNRRGIHIEPYVVDEQNIALVVEFVSARRYGVGRMAYMVSDICFSYLDRFLIIDHGIASYSSRTMMWRATYSY